MRQIYLLLLITTSLVSQGQFTDNFSDGDFSANPSWIGDISDFEVDLNNQLHLNAPAATSESYLSTSSAFLEPGSWEFYVDMDFNPSSSNYASVFLTSDQADLTGPLNGYFVRIGGATSDRISLYRQDGSSTDALIESADDWVDLNQVQVRIRVNRDASGNWTLEADTSAGFTGYTTIGSIQDITHTTGTHFGVRCTYTSTRSDRFYFDDFDAQGTPLIDTAPPAIQSFELALPDTVRLFFNEALDPASVANTSQYELLGTGIAASATLIGSSEIQLIFPTPFQNGQLYTLRVSGVQDISGNTMVTKDLEIFYYDPVPGDIVWNEIMVDPSPPINLPNTEYVEVYNRSPFPINLENFILVSGSTVRTMPTVTVQPDSTVLLVDDGQGQGFPGIANKAEMDLPSLSNSGGRLQILTPSGKLSDIIDYDISWYRDGNKEDGGWSIERIDVDFLCGEGNNWRASTNPNGGTPGRTNSVVGTQNDIAPPRVVQVGVNGDSAIFVLFDERMDSTSFTLPEAIEFIPNIQPSDFEIVAQGPLFKRIDIYFENPLDSQTVYRIALSDWITDCSGNPLVPDTFRFAIPSEPLPGDLVINELLFDPFSGGEDYVELYNLSNRVIDLYDVQLAQFDTTFGIISSVENIVVESQLLFPGEYALLTEDTAVVRELYFTHNTEAFIQVENIPSMGNDEGNMALVTRGLELLEYAPYNSEWHYPLLSSVDGVSLEKISPNLDPTRSDSWHSASSTVGFGTPGVKNSQFIDYNSDLSNSIEIVPMVFSPNGDGYKDLAIIQYDFDKTGYLCTIKIYDERGVEERILVNNEILGTSGQFTWDGVTKAGVKGAVGIHIFVIELTHSDGERQTIKKTCVLSY
jgi:hypothetical protein